MFFSKHVLSPESPGNRPHRHLPSYITGADIDAVQKTRRLKSAADIPGIFIRAGVYPGEYSKALASREVAELTEKQKRLFREYGVTSTPSVFVNGRYRIENSAFHANNIEDFRESYVEAVKSLLDITNK